MKYRLTINGVDHFPESDEQLKHLLDFARGQVYAHLSLTQLHDHKAKLLTKLILGIFLMKPAKELIGSELWALINGKMAIAFFIHHIPYHKRQGVDIEDLFFRSTNPDYGQEENRKVEFIVGSSNLVRDPGSEAVKHPERNCLATAEVMNAFLSFYKNGVRPDCIDWEIDRYDEDEDADIDSDL
jgi:hypothetical protein